MTALHMMHRRREPELMDQPGLDEAAHRQALRGLARINRISRSATTIWRPLAELARKQRRPLRVLDVACGGGDVTAALQRRAHAARLPITIDGCDVSDVALRHARALAAHADLSPHLFQTDAVRSPLPSRPTYDVVVSSLFLHHLDRDDAVTLLANMRRAADHLLIDDLDRSRLGLLAAHVGTRLLSASPIVHVDGPRSVRGAFTVDEVRAMAAEAGLGGATVSRHWPFRWLLGWSRA